MTKKELVRLLSWSGMCDDAEIAVWVIDYKDYCTDSGVSLSIEDFFRTDNSGKIIVHDLEAMKKNLNEAHPDVKETTLRKDKVLEKALKNITLNRNFRKKDIEIIEVMESALQFFGFYVNTNESVRDNCENDAENILFKMGKCIDKFRKVKK